MSNPICHWELMVSNVEKTKTFYRSVFDWTFDERSFPGYTMIATGKEPGGGLMAKPASAPMAALNVYFQVDDLQRTLAKVVESGGRVIVPKTEIPGIGWFAMFQDPENIAVGLLQEVPR